MKQIKILIAGAGISGLAAAISLSGKGIPFRIIEQKQEWEKRGYAMAVQGEGIDAAASLGIIRDIRNTGIKRTLKRIETYNGKLVTSRVPEQHGENYTVTRNFLHTVLAREVSNVEFGLSIKETSYTGGKQHVLFSNGTEDIFDLIIGADGINSPLRDRINTGSSIRYAGIGVWNIMIKDYFPEIIEIWDKNTLIAFYPLKEGTSVSLFSRMPSTYFSSIEDRKNDILTRFKGHRQKTVSSLLQNAESDIFFGSVRNVQAPAWFDRGIILIGDAAHGVSPLSGMGANLAMADAVGIAEILSSGLPSDTTHKNLIEFVKNRKAAAVRAFRTGNRRKKRAFLQAPFTLFRNHRISTRPWRY